MYSNELISNILNYIDNNLYSEISIDMISGIFCYDKFYIMKKFKKELGISIINYINAMRILNSLNSFKDDNTILKIAFNNGFNSLEYFSETFKKVIGVSPLTYKKFVNYDIRISTKDSDTILNSIIRLNTLRKFCESYKQKIKPRDAKVKKLSIFG